MSPRVLQVLAAHACTAGALGLAWPGMLEEVWRDGRSAAMLGLAGALRMLPYVICSGSAGRLADRVPRGSLIRRTALLRAGLAGLAAALLAAGRPMDAVIVSALMVAAATPVYPAAAAGMPWLAGPACGAATRVLVTIEASAFVVSPAAGGALLAVADAAVIGAGAAVLALLGGALMLGVDLPRSGAVPGSRRASGRACRSVLRSDRVAGRAVLSVVAVNAVYGALSVLLVTVTESRWPGAGDAYPTLTAALGAGALVAPLAAAVLTGPAGGRVALLLTAVPLALVAGSGWLAASAVLLVVSGIGSVCVEALATGVIQERVPDGLRASILGLLDCWMVTAAMLTAGVAPLLARYLPAGVLLGVLALALAVLAAMAPGRPRRRRRRVRRVRRVEVPQSLPEPLLTGRG